MIDFNRNLSTDVDFSIEEIKRMSEEEIRIYNENPWHELKIRDMTELIIFGFIPLVFSGGVQRRTQKSQRKYIRIAHFIIYAIVFALFTIIASVAS